MWVCWVRDGILSGFLCMLVRSLNLRSRPLLPSLRLLVGMGSWARVGVEVAICKGDSGQSFETTLLWFWDESVCNFGRERRCNAPVLECPVCFEKVAIIQTQLLGWKTS